MRAAVLMLIKWYKTKSSAIVSKFNLLDAIF